MPASAIGPGLPRRSTVRDERLRLLFACCHPALSPRTRVALALHRLGGLSTAEVARALLTTEDDARRFLDRGARKVVAARIPVRVPRDGELPERLPDVLATVHLVFTEGYAPSGGADAVRGDLVDEAVRLGRSLRSALPDEPGVLGLLALMLLVDCRRAARARPDGSAVRLCDQRRELWDRRLAAEGLALVAGALRRSRLRPDRYVVQAAIAGCHVLAPTYDRTDWHAIIGWYDVLLTLDDSPAARLARAAAVAERDGAQAGLDAVLAVPGLEQHAWWYVAQSELLHRLGREEDAAEARDHAVQLGLNAAAAGALGAAGTPRSGRRGS